MGKQPASVKPAETGSSCRSDMGNFWPIQHLALILRPFFLVLLAALEGLDVSLRSSKSSNVSCRFALLIMQSQHVPLITLLTKSHINPARNKEQKA